ncbi:hypothetical protein ALMP_59680 [Streptomyces sp. A012304]|nr:hypothetical protein ALMP_59680 [Streptomyces sp. A012304]
MGGTTLVQGGLHGEPPNTPARCRPREPPPPTPVRSVFLALTLALSPTALEPMIVATVLPKIVGELHGAHRMSWPPASAPSSPWATRRPPPSSSWPAAAAPSVIRACRHDD